MNNHVPFLDLVTPHRELEAELMAVVQDALRTGRFIGGQAVEEFEREFARFCGTAHSVGVGSGTDALRFALTAAGVKQGDAVITVPFTFIATAEAISQAGALPLFVDIHPATLTLDPVKLQEFLDKQCRTDETTGRSIHRATGRPVSAVIPVHLYGQTADMNAISAIAAQHHLLVIEDACQAHGAFCQDPSGQWRPAGSFGQAAAFSFYPGKNLGACGEGGAVTTGDSAVAERVRMLRDHGQIEKYVHRVEGTNGRLDAIQAGFLSVKLRKLSDWNEQRRRIARRYNELLFGINGIELPHEPSWSRGVYHIYAVRTENRTGLKAFLADANIATGLHYPIPLHLQQAYRCLGYQAADFPVSERAAEEVLSLPMFPGLAEEQLMQVAESVRAFARRELPLPAQQAQSPSVPAAAAPPA